MPRKKTTATPEPTPISGYVRRARYREIAFELPDMEEGETPLKAKIRRNLSWDELDEIPSGEHVTFEDAWAVIYPYVVEWNMMAEDAETGEMVAAPPPAEAGPDVWRLLNAEESLWLIMQVKSAHLGGLERKNDSAPSGDTPEPDGARS